jgi:hypothetical protein
VTDGQAAGPEPAAGGSRGGPQALEEGHVHGPGGPARADHVHPGQRLGGGGEVALAQHEGGQVRVGIAAGRALPALDGDEARAAGGEGDEAVQRLQRHAARAAAGRAAAAAEVFEGAVAEARGGVGVALGVGVGGREAVEGDDEGGAEVREEGGVEGGAEVAAAVDVGELDLAGCSDDGVVGRLEEEDAARDEVVDLAVDRAARRIERESGQASVE